MTRAQALRLVRSWWGPKAATRDTGLPRHDCCRVGVLRHPGTSMRAFIVMGAGPTWQAAVDDAQRRGLEHLNQKGVRDA